MRRRHLALVAPVVAVLVAIPAAAYAAPTAPRSYAAAIETYAPYVGQSTCSATAKPGLVAWRDQLLRTYSWTRSLGIVRGCTVGGRSEHKEGRALDWGVNASSSRDVAAVNDLFKWMFASDRYGNGHAIVRRLGIMYIIWNRRIWSAYNASSGWRAYTGASPHTDHVHFSFSWPGANKVTSYWTGKVAAMGGGSYGGTGDGGLMPDDDVIGEPQPPATLGQSFGLTDEKLYLDARRATGTTTQGSLYKGVAYLVEARGTYQYRTGGRADAECSMSPSSPTSWRRTRSLDYRSRDADFLDVYLNGIDGRFAPDSADDCDVTNHMYRWTYVPERTGRANFRIWDSRFTDNSGGLSIHVVKLLADDSDQTFFVHANAPTGQTGRALYRDGVDYVVEVTGTYVYSASGGKADAECSVAGTDWRRDRPVGPDYLDILFNGADPGGDPLVDDGGRCDTTTHTYRFDWSPRWSTTLSAKVYDAGHKDNSGALKVRVVRSDLAGRLGAAPELPPEVVAVDSRDSDGVATARSYQAGVAYELVARGTYVAGAGVTADAECTATATDPTWRDLRSSTLAEYRLWDVTVNGRTRDWTPVAGGGTCSSAHEYRFVYTPGSSGPLHLGVRDVTFGDNEGSVSVTIRRA